MEQQRDCKVSNPISTDIEVPKNWGHCLGCKSTLIFSLKKKFSDEDPIFLGDFLTTDSARPPAYS